MILLFEVFGGGGKETVAGRYRSNACAGVRGFRSCCLEVLVTFEGKERGVMNDVILMRSLELLRHEIGLS